MLRIEEILKEKGLTKGDLAECMGISRQTLHSHLTGNPSLDILNRFAAALGVDIRELFDKPSETELTALVEHQKEFYKAETLKELETIVDKIKRK